MKLKKWINGLMIGLVLIVLITYFAYKEEYFTAFIMGIASISVLIGYD